MEPVQALDPSKIDLSSQSFLSPEQVATPRQPINAFPKPPIQNNIPDLHNVELNANAAERKVAMNNPLGTTTERLKQEIMNEMIEQDIASATNPTGIALPENPKDALKFLIAKGQYTKNVKLYGFTWTMRALDQRDVLLAYDSIKLDMESDAARVATIMFIQVIYSIEAINGKSIYEWFPEIIASNYTKKEEYFLAIKMALKTYFEHMPSYFIDSFYMEYNKIEEERAKIFEELKNL